MNEHPVVVANMDETCCMVVVVNVVNLGHKCRSHYCSIPEEESPQLRMLVNIDLANSPDILPG